MTPIDSTPAPRVESVEWITGLASMSLFAFKCVLIVEDTPFTAWNGARKRLLCAAARKKAKRRLAVRPKNIFGHVRRGGGGSKKIKKSKSEDRKSKIENLDFAREKRKHRIERANQWDRLAVAASSIRPSALKRFQYLS
jgi:hypothetical protein